MSKEIRLRPQDRRPVDTPRGFARPLALAAALICLSLPGATNAATLGPEDMTADAGGYTCLAGLTCTRANIQLPAGVAGKEQAPFSGKIKKWRVSIPAAHDTYTNDGAIALQVLKRTAKLGPGPSDNEYAAVRESEFEDVTPDSVNSFGTNLRIRKGQFIGLAHADIHTEVVGGGVPGGGLSGYMSWFSPALVPGAPGESEFDHQNDYFVFNARLVRD